MQSKQHLYLPKLRIEIWVQSLFSAIVFPRISSVPPMERLAICKECLLAFHPVGKRVPQ